MVLKRLATYPRRAHHDHITLIFLNDPLELYDGLFWIRGKGGGENGRFRKN
jgi:hypothetical protein